MPRYRVERKCYFRNRLFDPHVEPVVNLDVKPKDAPRHFTCIDKPQKQQRQGAQKQASEGSGSEPKEQQGKEDQGQASEGSESDSSKPEEKAE